VALWRTLVLPAGIAVVAAALAGVVAWTMKPAVSRPVTRFSITLPADDEFSPVIATRTVVAVSPDGSRIAYVSSGPLHVRARDQLADVTIVGSGGSPFFSPDGQWLGFWDEGQLKRVSVNGSASVPIAKMPTIFGGHWESDDTILYGLGPSGVWRVRAAGGEPQNVIKLNANESAHGPQLLPDGRSVLFTLAQRGQSWDDAQIVAQSIDGGTREIIVQGGTDARYLPTGHLVYARRGRLLALRFNPGDRKAAGDAVQVLEGVAQSVFTGAAQFNVSADGTLVYVPSSSLDIGAASFVWVDRTGHETPVSGPSGLLLAPSLSPDGGRVAFIRVTGDNLDIWTFEFRRGILQPLTTEPGRDSDPIWSPDGSRIAYYSISREGGPGIFVRAADGTGDVERLTTGIHTPNSWSPDGTRLVYSDFGTATISSTSPTDLRVVLLNGDRRTEPVLVTPVREGNAVISPDGRWLAYESSETGEKAIWVRPFPDVSKGRTLISTAGGVSPVWARDGRTLFYRDRQTIMAVPVRGSTPADWGKPERVTEGSYFWINGPTMFDVAPDGRFLMLKANSGNAATGAPKDIIVVQNWFEELKRLVPVN
jgi:serine/threonine-protein kinase